jgi:hypothetical protein
MKPRGKLIFLDEQSPAVNGMVFVTIPNPETRRTVQNRRTESSMAELPRKRLLINRIIGLDFSTGQQKALQVCDHPFYQYRHMYFSHSSFIIWQ